MSEAIIVLTTVEALQNGENIAQLLIEKELAACVQILPPMTSIYRWQGKIEKAIEHLLLIKTRRELYPSIESEIRFNHPYQTPEIIVLSIEDGSKDYLSWLNEATKKQF
ncbi:MAG TPA: divalent-cation tolerance protein CutA [Blastocatellia bacterium]|nr:divalent-cation tolerance protein CutA [Blastocatellia bacterium]